MNHIETYKAPINSILHRNLLVRMINQLFKSLVKKGKECISVKIRETESDYLVVYRISKKNLLNKDQRIVERNLQYYIQKLDEATYDEYQ